MDKIKKNKFEQSNSIKDKKKKLNIKNKVNSKINIETIQNDLKKAKDDSLRHLAEIDNLRKRYEKEREDTFNYAITEFASEIILVLDNFTRVKTSISLINKEDNQKVKPLIEGVDLIFKDFQSTLEKFNIKKIDSLNQKFDPNLHQAISEEESNDKQEGQIIKVIQEGYFIKDRLLRPASVVIAKKKKKIKLIFFSPRYFR